jgi:hypothetical protein
MIKKRNHPVVERQEGAKRQPPETEGVWSGGRGDFFSSHNVILNSSIFKRIWQVLKLWYIIKK